MMTYVHQEVTFMLSGTRFSTDELQGFFVLHKWKCIVLFFLVVVVLSQFHIIYSLFLNLRNLMILLSSVICKCSRERLVLKWKARTSGLLCKWVFFFSHLVIMQNIQYFLSPFHLLNLRAHIFWVDFMSNLYVFVLLCLCGCGSKYLWHCDQTFQAQLDSDSYS